MNLRSFVGSAKRDEHDRELADKLVKWFTDHGFTREDIRRLLDAEKPK